jgi:hypothetical protein
MGLFSSSTYFAPSYFAPSYFAGASFASISVWVVDMVSHLQANCPGVSFWPGKLPQQLPGGYPAASYLLVDGDDPYQLSGPSGLAREQFQFDCWSTDPLEAYQVAESIRLAFLGAYPRTIGGTRVLEANRHPRLSSYDPGVDGSDEGYNRVMLEYTFIYQTST